MRIWKLPAALCQSPKRSTKILKPYSAATLRVLKGSLAGSLSGAACAVSRDASSFPGMHSLLVRGSSPRTAPLALAVVRFRDSVVVGRQAGSTAGGIHRTVSGFLHSIVRFPNFDISRTSRTSIGRGFGIIHTKSI